LSSGSSNAADFLVRWPCLESLQRAKASTIERFILDHNSRERKTYDKLAYQRVLAAGRPKAPKPGPVELQWKNVAGFSNIVVTEA
jgi:hypothetical protein